MDRAVKAVYKDTVDKRIIRELELEENIQREAYTPAEEVNAIRDLHKLKQELYGESSSGRADGWKLSDTAKVIGKTKGSVIEAIKIADILTKFPELGKFKTKKAIKRAATKANILLETMDHLSVWKKELKNTRKVDIQNKDSFEYIKEIKDGSIDIICTDPPYGIDIDKIAQGYEGDSKNVGSATFKYRDSREQGLEYMERFAPESFRITSSKAHLYIFCATELFCLLKEMFTKASWNVYTKPIIWIKRPTGQCNAPHKWPVSCYESILYANKPKSTLVLQGRPNWIQCDPLTPTKRLHQSEKPIPLLLDLLERVSFPGQTLLDPFMGSGAVLEAGLQKKLIVKGTDILEECYSITAKRLTTYLRRE